MKATFIGLTWSQAITECGKYGAKLPVILSQSDNLNLFQKLVRFLVYFYATILKKSFEILFKLDKKWLRNTGGPRYM